MADDAIATGTEATLVTLRFEAHDALATALDQALSALLGAAMAVAHAEACTALRVAIADDATASRTEAAEVLVATHEALSSARNHALGARSCATCAFRPAKAITALAWPMARRGAQRTVATSIDAFDTKHALPAALEKTVMARVVATFTFLYADSLAANSTLAAHHARAVGVQTAAVCVLARNAGAATLDQAWVALLRTARPVRPAEAVAALGILSAENASACRTHATLATVRIARQALATARNQAFGATGNASSPILGADAITTLGLWAADDAMAVRS